MIKVLHVLGYMPVGGVGTLLLGLNNNIDKNYIQMDCLLFKSDRKSNFSQEWKKSGGRIETIPFELKPKNYFKIKKFLNTFFEESNYDIVHLHSPNLGFMIFPIAKKNKIEIRILHSHSIIHSEKKIRSIRNSFLVKIGNRKSNYHIACSQEAGKFLFPNNNFLFLPNGIEVESYLFIEKKRELMRTEIPKEAKIIGMIGNLTNVKNQEFILNIAPKLLEKNENFYFWFIGDGNDKEKLNILTKKLNLINRVTFFGRKTDISSYLQAMDIFVMPSKFEGFGISALEAQGSGLPCVLSNNIPKEICINKNVRFISLKDEEEWIRQIYEFAEDNSSRIENGKKIEESIFSIKNSAKILSNYYIRISGGK